MITIHVWLEAETESYVSWVAFGEGFWVRSTTQSLMLHAVNHQIRNWLPDSVAYSTKYVWHGYRYAQDIESDLREIREAA